jgi:hypothetical protein
MGEEKCLQNLIEKLKLINNMGNLGVDRRIILKWILNQSSASG